MCRHQCKATRNLKKKNQGNMVPPKELYYFSVTGHKEIDLWIAWQKFQNYCFKQFEQVKRQPRETTKPDQNEKFSRKTEIIKKEPKGNNGTNKYSDWMNEMKNAGENIKSRLQQRKTKICEPEDRLLEISKVMGEKI